MSEDRALCAAALAPTKLYIDGEWVETEQSFAVRDPATETVIARVADATPEHALRALSAATTKQDSWADTTPRERADLLRALFDEVRNRSTDITEVITAEMGKPLPESRGEVAYGAEFLRWFSEQAAHVHGDYGPAPKGGSRIITTQRPVGPSLLITPWNFPLAMLTRKLGAAMAAGCTTVLKPAAQTPLTAALLTDLADQVGIPAGVVNLVPTTHPGELSSALMTDARLRKVSFTGSTPVGSTLLRQSADHVQRTSLELGGNGPFLVFADADIDGAVESAMLAKFRNGGESCVAANRFLVHEDIAEEFASRFVERVSQLRTGSGFDDGVAVGPLIDERQRDKVAGLVDDAVASGATVRTGGRAPESGGGHFYPPTVLVDVGNDAAILREEIFGPVAPISTFSTDDEAVSMANATSYGLSGFLCTRDLDRALTVGERLEVGMVGINRGIVSEPAAPFGGIKASGLGREGGPTGIEEYLETKYMALSL